MAVVGSSQTPVVIYWQRKLENRILKQNSSLLRKRSLQHLASGSFIARIIQFTLSQLTSLGSTWYYPPSCTKVSKLYIPKKSSCFVAWW